METRKNDVVTLYGPCHKCGEKIEEPETPVMYRDHVYHQKCCPTKREEKASDTSYT